MKRVLLAAVTLAVVSAGAAAVYQAVDRAREYRELLARGDQALRDEDTFAAIEAFSGAIALRPDSMLAHFRRGETYQRRGELEEAVRDFGTAAALDPAAIRPLEALGDVLYELDSFSQASATYGRALALDDRSVRLSYKLALARYHNEDLDGTLAALKNTLRLNARLPDATHLLGMCLREKGRNAEAIQAFETAVSLAPGLIAAREELADLYGAAGRHTEEIAQLQTLAGLDGERIERQIALGLAHARAGHADLAVLTLGSALERSPENPLVYAALGQVWLNLADERTDALRKALEALRLAASSPDATSDILTMYGRALIRDGQFDAAEGVLQRATVHYPIDTDAWMLGASAAEHLGHLDSARGALVKYSSLIPDGPALVLPARRIAELSLRLNDPRTAVTWFTRAVVLAPSDPDLATLLADAQRRVR
jgi:Flp pilus assembly protein TadD